MECQAFLDSMASRTPPVTDGRMGTRVLSVLEAARESMEKKGQSVAIGSV